MSNTEEQDQQGGVSVRALEIVVASAIILLAAIVMFDNWRIGAGWAADGPQAGYFPFYVGLAMLISSAIVLFNAIVVRKPRQVFVETRQLQTVLTLLVPSIIYVVIAAYLGVYFAAAWYAICIVYFAVIGRHKLVYSPEEEFATKERQKAVMTKASA